MGKKSVESNGVIAMINLLIKDLDKEMTEAVTAEEEAQRDYENSLGDAAAKRARDSKSMDSKNGALQDENANHQGHKEDLAGSQRELQATNKVIADLHAECDWLV